jgi:hypothetical protein
MKEETLKKGSELQKQIESVQLAKEALVLITQGELSNPSKTFIRVRLETKRTFFDNNPNTPVELTEMVREEFIRFIQRAKRHCEEWEHKLKEELEDL